MTTPVANLSIELSAGVAGLKTDFGKAQREAAKAAQQMEATFNKAGAVIGAALVAGLAGVGAAIAKTVNEFDRLGDVAAKLNTTTAALSALGFAAERSGTSAETLENGLGRLNKTIGEALSGNRQAAELFDSLGVSLRNADGSARSADSVFLSLSDRFQQFRDGPQEAAAAVALFGRAAGPELLQLLNSGSAGIAEFEARAKALGVVISDDAVAAAQTFRDNLDDLGAAAKGISNGLTTSLVPALAAITSELTDAIVKAGGFESVGKAIGDAIKTVAGVFIAGAAQIQKVGAAFAFVVDIGTKFAGNLRVIADIAVAAFQNIANAASGNFVAAAKGAQIVDRAVLALAQTVRGQAAASFRVLQDTIADIDANAERRIGALSKQFKDLAKAGAEANKGTIELPDIFDNTGNAAGKAAPKVRELAIQVDAFARQGTPAASTAMQQLVQDIDLGAISFDNLRESQVVLNQTTTEEAQFFADNWQGAVGAAQDAFADFIAGNIKSFEDFGDALESIARQFLANLVRQFLSTNLQLNVSGGPGGGLGAVGGSGFLNILNGGGAALSTLGPAALLLAGASTGNRGTGALSGGLAGGLFASTTFGAGVIGSGLSGLGLGASLGSVVPIVGTIIGAIIGGLAANLFAAKPPSINVIGDNIVGTPGFRNFAPGSTFESRLGGFTFASIDTVDRQTREQIGQSVVQFDNTIADLLNADQLDKVTDALANFNLRLTEGAISADNILGERFNAILSTFDQDIQDFVNGAATLEERTQRLAEILSRPQRLNALIDSLEEVDRLSGLSPFERELDAINKQFDAAAEEARKLGADQAQLARIEELRGNAIERLNDLQRQNLDALLDDLRFDDITDGLTPADRAIADINRRFDKLREQAIALGASQEDLELIERRRTAALREQADATRDSTDAIQEFTDTAQQSFQLYLDYQADWLEGLGNALQPVRDWLNRGASVTSENPLQQLTRSQQQFEDLARRASLGDFDAIRNIAGAGDALLQQAARFYGVGSADFQRYEALVRGTLTPLASVDGSQSMAIALGQLREIYQALLRFLQGGNGANNSGVMSGAQAQQLLNSLDRLSRRTDRVT